MLSLPAGRGFAPSALCVASCHAPARGREARRRSSARQDSPGLAGFPDTLLGVFVTALVNLYTDDIEAGLRFYRDLLGFEETFRTPTSSRSASSPWKQSN
jgi:Glyoxalase/Bleomycin resistance protein/Dioxygenase superfamily